MQKRFIFYFLLFSFIANIILPYPLFAQTAAVYGLPVPGTMLNNSKVYSYPVLKGVRIDPENPAYLEFIIDSKNQRMIDNPELKRLISYFMAALTIPEQDLWVNLSPNESNRITSDKLVQTELGKELLAQDYILKQLAASLTHPESNTGKEYWNENFKSQISNFKSNASNALAKVWIVPDYALIYEDNNTAVIKESTMKAMSEESSPALKTLLPALTNEVNNGENFARLRQVHSAFLLASWFKKKLKDTAYKHYIDQGKTNGIQINAKNVKSNIYNLYVEAFNKGAYDLTKKSFSGSNFKSQISNIKFGAQSKITTRRYFCGGIQESNDGTKNEKNPDGVAEEEAAAGTIAGIAIIPHGTHLTGEMKKADTTTQPVPQQGSGEPFKVENIEIEELVNTTYSAIANFIYGHPLPASIPTIIITHALNYILDTEITFTNRRAQFGQVLDEINKNSRYPYNMAFVSDSDDAKIIVWEKNKTSAGSMKSVDRHVTSNLSETENVPQKTQQAWHRASRALMGERKQFCGRPVTFRAIEDSDAAPMPEGINAWHDFNPNTDEMLIVTRRGLPAPIKRTALTVHEPGEASWQVTILGKLENIKTINRIAHILQSTQERRGNKHLTAYDAWDIEQMGKETGHARLQRLLSEVNRSFQHKWIKHFLGAEALAEAKAYEKIYYAALEAKAKELGVGGIKLTTEYADIRVKGNMPITMPAQLSHEFELCDGATFKVVFLENR